MNMPRLAEWDHAALHWINSHHHAVLDWLLLPVSFLGEAGVVWVLLGLGLIILARGRTRMTGLLLLASMLVADRLIASALGDLLYRSRPYLDEPALRQMGIRWSGSSFPSAHSHSAVIGAILLGGEYRPLRPLLWAFVVLTLYSRPYLGMHHPLDTLAGAAVGALVGLLAVLLRRRWAAKESPSSQG